MSNENEIIEDDPSTVLCMAIVGLAAVGIGVITYKVVAITIAAQNRRKAKKAAKVAAQMLDNDDNDDTITVVA